MVTSSKPQFENPISNPDAIPVGATFRNDLRQSICIRDLPVTHLYRARIAPDINCFNIK